MNRLRWMWMWLLLGLAESSNIKDPLQISKFSLKESSFSSFSSNSSASIAWADFNGDTSLDFIVTYADAKMNASIFVQNALDSSFRRLSSFSIAPFNLSDSDSYDTIHVETAELNGDGISDFVVVQSSGLRVFLSSFSSSSSSPSWFPFFSDNSPQKSSGDLWLMDWDGNGLLDIIFIGSEVRFYSNIGNSSSPNFSLKSPFSSEDFGEARGAIGDLNGDGKKDLIVFGEKSKEVFLGLDPKIPSFLPNFAKSFPKNGTILGNEPMVLADFNSDGDLDLLINNSSYFINNSSGIFSNQNFSLFPRPKGTEGIITAIDYDGDGMLDIFYCNPPALYRNIGGNNFLIVSQNFSTGTKSCKWGDFNNDGFPDLLLLTDHKVTLYTNTLYSTSSNTSTVLMLSLDRAYNFTLDAVYNEINSLINHTAGVSISMGNTTLFPTQFNVTIHIYGADPSDTYVAARSILGGIKNLDLTVSFVQFATPRESECPSIDPKACLGNGECVDEDNDGSGYCDCPEGYIYGQCQVEGSVVPDISMEETLDSKRLSGGTIAGIVIGVIVFTFLLGLILLAFAKLRGKEKPRSIELEER